MGGQVSRRSIGRHRMVVRPGESVACELVEYGASRGIVEQVEGQVVDETVGGTRDQEPAVRERWAWTRAEPAVGKRKCAREAVVERQILAGPVTHSRVRGFALRHDRLGACDE